MTLDEKDNETKEDGLNLQEASPNTQMDYEMNPITEEKDENLSQEKPFAKKANGKGLIYDLIFYVVLIFISLYILPNYVIQRTIVDGASMENTILDGEHLFVEMVSYRFKELDRFDIVVFYPYGRDNEEYYVKRIIGLPGEGVQIVNDEIYINGSLLEENYGKEDWIEPGRGRELVILGEDEYFVMGDNRANSIDSRDSDVGNVSKENIGGKVIFRILPFNRMGTID